jgi:KUP system potassium uptake protein
MVGTIVVTAAYSNTTNLGNAYGVCVIFVTFITTCMVSLVAIVIWKIHFLLVLFLFLVFACLDGVYLSSALTKIPTGAWLTLLLAAILSSVFILWRFGKEQQWAAEALDNHSLTDMLVPATSAFPERLAPNFGSHNISQISGVGVFFDKVGTKVPIVFQQFVQKCEYFPRNRFL